MENADGGDLYNKILTYKKKSQFIPEKEIWHYFIQMVRGLSALHDLKIMHRDIKCANIFLTKDGVLKLGDLNVSKVAKRGML
jgi:NIMA (never in mitosis gene a)-related kinase